MNDIEYLRTISDVTDSEFDKIKERIETDGGSKCNERIAKVLMSRSKIPQIRNFFRPPAEIYAPIFYTPDYFMKLVKKDGWGGYIISLTTWDLLIIDIDIDLFTVDDIIEHLIYHYPNDKFHIHKTNKGWHIYLLSRPIRHSSKEALLMRIECGCDPAHGTNSLYTGNSIRLTRKTDDKLDRASVFMADCGLGKYDQNLKMVYDQIVKYIDQFKICDTLTVIENKTCMSQLQSMFESTPSAPSALSDVGKLQILATAPAVIIDGNFQIKSQFINKSPLLDMLYSKFLKSKTINTTYLKLLEYKISEVIGYNNFYRIFESNRDYAYGVHVQESLYFIVYKDLFMVDYDHKNRLKIIGEFCRYHPEYFFRCVKTPAGYHIFLTSHRINHDAKGTIDLLIRLGTDNFHAITVKFRGYSVRVNQKHRYEKPYKEICTYGKGTEDPELYRLYKIHLTKYEELCAKKEQLYRIQHTVTTDMIKIQVGL